MHQGLNEILYKRFILSPSLEFHSVSIKLYLYLKQFLLLKRLLNCMTNESIGYMFLAVDYRPGLTDFME